MYLPAFVFHMKKPVGCVNFCVSFIYANVFYPVRVLAFQFWKKKNYCASDSSTAFSNVHLGCLKTWIERLSILIVIRALFWANLKLFVSLMISDE